jgi:hypothetical protein
MSMAKTNVAPLSRERARPRPARIALPDGGTAELRGEALEIRDREGFLMVRYQDGAAEISAPRGDLRLAAPSGRVVIESALDVSVEAGRDVVHRAGRRFDVCAAAPADEPQLRVDHAGAEVRADRLDVQARSVRAVLGQAALVARAIATTADRVAVTAGDYERMAGRVVERARDSFREVADLCEERAGRVRALVRGVYALSSRRTAMTSTEDTSIDGSRILLG